MVHAIAVLQTINTPSLCDHPPAQNGTLMEEMDVAMLTPDVQTDAILPLVFLTHIPLVAQANPQYRSNDYRRRNRRQNQTQSHDRNSALFHLQSQNALQHQYLNVTSNSPSQNLRSSKPSYLPHQICREDLIPNRFECEDQMSFVPPTGPRIWRQPSRRIQEPLLPSPSPRLQYFGQPQLIENEHDIDMTDATEETTDIEMTDAPPIWCDGAQTWINEPTKIVAEGLASVNAVLTRLEWYVRTGNMPVGIVPSTQASLF
ncbi:hypothetical protein POX_d05017 [Penicillium oxalicum]|uniref:hypothetical protein n=1 Tax=Penicillium oxalicum TaxID=69781 RepID=UPI0020B69E5B|nr:hypothetical protein POX_d05017 [Penicillium oxalicum]KAI2789524.1 hypothetical protein POX_d05017 [Penicillium oxalicum]